jgi:hypothetical protein
MAAAAAGISLTDRRYASSVVFATAHRGHDAEAVAWDRLVTSHSTLAIYMPGSNYKILAEQLCQVGLDPQTSCAVISAVAVVFAVAIVFGSWFIGCHSEQREESPHPSNLPCRSRGISATNSAQAVSERMSQSHNN